ncbi:MAG: P-loop NTPase [Thermodesulfobacteriota bacterium]|nr:P-loop NTPase [Thermodesulfobacteriota bacterium]
MEWERKLQIDTYPQIWAVGGGKGGIGKSTVSILLAFWLARMGKRTILADLDLGGANLHTLMGIKSPPRTLNDFVTRRIDSLEEICIETDIEDLRLICGASDVLTLANPHVAQKIKIIHHVTKLDADYIVLDLGAGTSFNVLDFFLVADRKIVVLMPQPTAIQNAYSFVRNAVYRRLSRLASQQPPLQSLIKSAMDENNELRVRTIRDLLQAAEDISGKEIMETLQEEIKAIRPAVITNMVTNSSDKNAGRVIQLVSEKYLMVNPRNLGGVAYDKQISQMVSDMVPITKLGQSSDAFANTYDITMKLL